jgi:hypothetical protein
MALRFLDRSEEIGRLRSFLAARGGGLAVLYGRRRCGKSRIIQEVLPRRGSIYYVGDERDGALQRASLAAEAGRLVPGLERVTYPGWDELLSALWERAPRPAVLAIDEFPYLIEANPAIPSLLQRAWDEQWKNSRLFVLLLGSSVGMMETEVLGHRSPLFGRRTGQWKLTPFRFTDAIRFRPKDDFDSRMHYYAVAGGMPAYWLQFEARAGFWENLQDRVLRKGAFLYEEVEFLLREEVREPRNYFALLAAIAAGKRRLAEIVNATGLTKSTANKYLSVLADLGIVHRELPVTESKPLKSKKGLYRLEDPFTRFWFEFIYPHRDRLEMGETRVVLKKIRETFPAYLGHVYEDAARDILHRHSDALPSFARIGRWWDRNQEIDLVGVDEERNSIIFGEVKWTAKPVGRDIYEALKTKASGVRWGRKERQEAYCLFSRSGFSPNLTRGVRSEPLYLFHQDRLLARPQFVR